MFVFPKHDFPGIEGKAKTDKVEVTVKVTDDLKKKTNKVYF
jgi:hypothetical protein